MRSMTSLLPTLVALVVGVANNNGLSAVGAVGLTARRGAESSCSQHSAILMSTHPRILRAQGMLGHTATDRA